MQRTTCEYMMWNGLPVIRKEIALSMINSFGLSQKEAAEKMNLTPAAVCQYLARKRGKVKIIDVEILTEINITAPAKLFTEDIWIDDSKEPFKARFQTFLYSNILKIRLFLLFLVSIILFSILSLGVYI